MNFTFFAKLDLVDSLKRPTFWFFTALSVVLFFISVIIFDQGFAGQFSAEGSSLTSDNYIQGMVLPVRWVVPIYAISISYTSVNKNRNTGIISLLLALPISRIEFVLGTLLSRAMLLILPVTLGLLVAMLGLIVLPYPLHIVPFVKFIGLTNLLGLVFVGIAVGFSAGSLTNRRSLMGSIGTFIITSMFWSKFSRNLTLMVHGTINLTRSEALLTEVLLKHLSPIIAYRSLAHRVTIAGPMTARSLAIPRNLDRSNDVIFLLRNVFHTDVPWYLTDFAVLCYLLVWLVIPLVVGALIFMGSDI